MADEDKEIAAELDATIQRATRSIEAMELERLLGGPYDGNNAIISINAGAGGTESQDWAQMILRMMLRWGERRGFSAEIMDTQAGKKPVSKVPAFC